MNYSLIKVDVKGIFCGDVNMPAVAKEPPTGTSGSRKIGGSKAGAFVLPIILALVFLFSGYLTTVKAATDTVLVTVVDTAAAQTEPTLDTSFFGGSGDQRGTGISISDGAIYVSGQVGELTGGPGDTSIVVRFSIPPDSPVWSRSWPFGALVGIASTNEGIYAAGMSHPGSGSGTSDGVGGTEHKSILAKFSLDGTDGSGPGGSIWVATPNFFAYRGFEQFYAVTTAVEDSSTFIYATGGAEPCGWGKFVIAKFDTSGILVSKATEPGFEPDFTSSCAVGRCLWQWLELW